MRSCFAILIILLSASANGQNRFDSLQIEKALMTLSAQASETNLNKDLIKAIETIDKHYRKITDTLFSYKSREHTILQTIFIETNDSVFVNPLNLGEEIRLTHIVFNNTKLNIIVDSVARHLDKTERKKLFSYLNDHFDNFSMDKKLHAQPVRIRYIKFPSEQLVYAGIDIYGAHFLWTMDKNQNWNVIKVERLWIY